MIVHNPVVSDARVRKEAFTLAKSGFNITLIGYGDSAYSPPCIEGVPLRIVQKLSFMSIYSRFSRLNEKFLRDVRLQRKHVQRLKRRNVRLMQKHVRLTRKYVNLTRFYARKFVSLQLNFTWTLLFGARKNRFITIIRLILQPLRLCTRLLLMLCRFFVNITWRTGFVLYLATSQAIHALQVLGKIFFTPFYKYVSQVLEYLSSLSVLPAYNYISDLLLNELCSDHYSVVHAHDIIALMAAVKYKKKHKSVVIVWDAHELYTEVSYKDSRASQYISRVIFKSSQFVDYFITINESISSFYSSHYPLLPPGRVLMNATRPIRFAVHKSTSPLRESTGISQRQKILLFQGGLAYGRGIELMLDAAANIKFPSDWSIVFMGDGALKSKIIDHSLVLNKYRTKAKPLITHLPPAPYEALTSWTAGADLGIIPYELTSLNHLYCTPNKLWEFPNAGVPILASSLVEMKTMIDKYETGYLMPSEFTAHDIIDALCSISESELEIKISNCAIFCRDENWHSYEPILLDLYQGLMI